MRILSEFKQFIASGNVVGLAVAVILGVAFGVVVTSFTNDILMQFIAAIGAKPSFGNLSFTLHGSEIRYGAFLNALVNFLIVAAVVFGIVKLYNRIAHEELKTPESERELLRQIRDSLRERTPMGT